MKFYTQTDITKSNTSSLNETTLDELITMITSDTLQEKIDSMQRVKNISSDSYNFIKRKLPYFIGAKFKNNIRNSANFEKINHFVIDIDKYGNSDDVENLKNKLSEDNRILFAFISPSGVGLKLVYSLEKPIYSLKKYSDFYKAFTLKLAKQYNLDSSIDYTTSDATRVCFLSYDKNIFTNSNPKTINPEHYISEFDLLNQPDSKNNNENGKKDSNDKQEISNQQYKDIISKLNNKTPKPEKNYIVPEILNSVCKKLKIEFEKYNLKIESIENISYGKKITIKDGLAFATFNLFYGKKGFTVVKTLVRNSNEQLLEVAVSISENYIYTNTIAYRINPLNNEQKEEKPTHQLYRTDDENKTGRIVKLKTAR